jgi:hypothetical protein
MLQAHKCFSATVKKYLWPVVLAAAIAPALLSVGNAGAASKNDRAVRLLATIPVPVTTDNTTAGGLYSFDISWVDQTTGMYYLADRSNKRVEIADADTGTFLTAINATPSFAGVSPPAFSSGTGGPNGVTTSGHCLFVTDAPSRVVSFDTSSFPPTQVSDVHTATMNPNRTDELAVDPKDSLILAINNQDMPPFGTFIKFDPTSCALTAPNPTTDRITFNTAGGVDAQNGAEQPLWDPITQKFYLSIPQIGSSLASGGVVRIDPTTRKIDGTFDIFFCSPAGLTKGPNNDVLVGCNTVFDTAGVVWTANDKNTAAPLQVILNVKTGDVDQVAGVGDSDEVWFNKGDGNYYTGSSRTPLGATTAGGATVLASSAAILGVIDAKDQEVLQLVPTYNVAAVTTGPASGQFPAGTAHSVAVDAMNNHIFVALAANNVFPNCLEGCIAVYWHGDEDQPGQAALP